MPLRSRFPFFNAQIGVFDLAVLEITDGTTTVSLVSRHYGIHLNSWLPARAKPKGGGIFKETALSSGRQLIAAPIDNPIESLTLYVNGADQDPVIQTLQDLDRLLGKAMDYWTAAWSDSPVWIRARSVRETNYRYALIVAAQIENYDNPYAQPFTNDPPNMIDIGLTIERGQWQNVEPGETVAVPISAYRLFNSRNLGNTNSLGIETPTAAAPGMFITNKDGRNNLTHMFQYDAGTAGFGLNMFAGALPHLLYPIPPAVGDILYMGSASAGGVLLPFSNVVFDLVVAGDFFTVVWEYWNGAWVTLLALDHTINFTQSGVNSVNWRIPSDWLTTAVNGVTAYWVRARIATASAPINPQQGNSYWYTANWPYIEVKAENIGGDMPALAMLRLIGINDRQGYNNDTGSEPRLWANRIIYGLRSMSRNMPDNLFLFQAFLSAAQNQSASPVGLVVTPYTDTAFVTDITVPRGQKAVYTPTGATSVMAPRVGWLLGTSVGKAYFGEYRIFIRARQNGGALGTILMYMQCQIAPEVGAPGLAVFTSETIGFPVVSDYSLIDFGRLKIDPGDLSSIAPVNSGPPTFTIGFILSMSTLSNAITADVVDLILIPVDEASGDLQDVTNSNVSHIGGIAGSLAEASQIIIDSAAYLRGELRANVTDITHATQLTGSYRSTYKAIKNGPIILQANARQRLWVLTAKRQITTADIPDPGVAARDWRSNFDNAHYVGLSAVQRYYGLRGSR